MSDQTPPEPYAFLRDLLEHHDTMGWGIEFGVFSGRSLAVIAEYMPAIGLDSFSGLPEDWREEFPKGAFATNEIPNVPGAMIVKGLFEDTLPVLRARGLPIFGFAHIDCDLYSSTVTALNGIRDNILVGTIVSFDEYHGYDGYQKHEAKAWSQFVAQNKITYTILSTGEQERAFRIETIG